jgi:hypothetical protein
MSLLGITLPLEIQTFLSVLFVFCMMSILSFFFESSIFFQRLAILLVTSLLPPLFLPLVAADSETVSDISWFLAGAETCLWISILVGVRLPSFGALLKPRFDDGLRTKPEVGLGILRLLEVVLEPEPCLDLDLSLKAEVLV